MIRDIRLDVIEKRSVGDVMWCNFVCVNCIQAKDNNIRVLSENLFSANDYLGV